MGIISRLMYVACLSTCSKCSSNTIKVQYSFYLFFFHRADVGQSDTYLSLCTVIFKQNCVSSMPKPNHVQLNSGAERLKSSWDSIGLDSTQI